MLRAVLVDLSGTLHIENEIIPGAIEALRKLRSTHLQIKFISNTTKESKRLLHSRLNKLGFDLTENEIYTSLSATRSLVAERNLKPLLILSPEAIEEFEGLTYSGNEQPNAVVIGLAPTEFHYNKLNEAFKCLINGGQLIAPHAGKYYKTKEGLALGPGPFIKGLEYAANCQAEIVGKPTESFFKLALGDVLPREAAMIGDDVDDDVYGAMAAGLEGFLVKTGKYRAGDEKKNDPPPTYVCKSFVEAVEIILDKVKASQTYIKSFIKPQETPDLSKSK